MIDTKKAIKFLDDQELWRESYPEDDLQEHIARQMQEYANQELSFNKDQVNTMIESLEELNEELSIQSKGSLFSEQWELLEYLKEIKYKL
jgi:hypothetical protein